MRLTLIAAAVAAAAGCGDARDGLEWSVRGGDVGEFVLHGNEVFTIGRRLAVYDVESGRRARDAPLPSNLANITRGQLGPGAVVEGDALAFGWYDFGAETATLFCVSTATLQTRWQWRIGWPWSERTLRPTLAVAADAQQVYAAAIGKDGDNVFAFRLADGALVWSRRVERFPAEAALALHEDRVIVRSQLWARPADRHQQIDALVTRDGARVWRTWLAGEPKYHLDAPLLHAGHLYTTTRDGPATGQLYRVRLSDGHTTRVPIPSSGAAFAAHDDVIYLGGWPPLAYDTSRARVLWRASLGYATEPDVSLIAGGGVDPDRGIVYVGDSQRAVYVLDAASGLLQRRIRVDRYARFQLFSPLKALFASYGVRRLQPRDGRLFVGTVDGSLFVFRAR